MAKDVKQSKLMAKMKKRGAEAWASSREKEPDVRSSLPPGIRNGVAQFVEWKLDEDKNGDPYFVLTGVVYEPEEHADRRVAIMHFISETEYSSIEDRLDRLCSDLKLLGADLDEAELGELPDIINALVEEEPFFLFNTFKRRNGDTGVGIQGPAEDFEPPEPEEGEEVEEEEPTATKREKPAKRRPAPEPEPEPDPDDAWQVGDRCQVDGDWVGTVASLDNEGAPALVTADEDEVDYDVAGCEVVEYEDEEPPIVDDVWVDDGDTEPAAGDDWVPEVDDVYFYKSGPKSAKKEVVVTAVDEEERTVDISRLEDDREFTGVPWDKLEGDE